MPPEQRSLLSVALVRTAEGLLFDHHHRITRRQQGQGRRQDWRPSSSAPLLQFFGVDRLILISVQLAACLFGSKNILLIPMLIQRFFVKLAGVHNLNGKIKDF